MTAGCPFKEAGKGGECTGAPGVLSAAEISKIIANGGKMTLDTTAAVQIVTWNTDQWVSWDDVKTLAMKVQYANRRCLGGLMVWALDLDDGTLIKSLANAGAPVQYFLGEAPIITPCFGTDWPADAFLNGTKP
jgi:chitinase